MTNQPRRFHLLRHVDITGASGTGIVAHGVQWPDGTASVRWAGDRPSVVFWDSIDDAIAVHGHGGATEIVWTDPDSHVDRYAAIAQLASALGDQLPGDGWHLADAIKRLADGTATPDEIAAELGE